MQTLSSKPQLTPAILWLMTILSGLVVANNYYNQPLLGLIANDFHVAESTVSKIPVLTQLGYACGLLFIVPLGDKLLRKRLILFDLVLVIAALLLMTFADRLWMLFVASFFIGVTSVIPQIFVPMAAELSLPDKKSANIGLVMSGLLMGILLSRFFSGIVGQYWGWRSMFGLAGGAMIVTWLSVFFLLPELKPNFKGSYISLMRSVWHLAKTEPRLQLAAFRGAMGFGAMSAVFTTLVFHLEGAPFFAGASIVGSFGLVGAAGALAAAFVGRLHQRFSIYQLIYFSLLILLLSWGFIYFGRNTYVGLIIGIILIDLGLQSAHIMNQTDYFSIPTNATSRLNTVYMVCYFMGGSLGTYLAALAWEQAGWPAVCAVGALFSLLALVAHLLFSKQRAYPTEIS
ncbi:MFS transporter [Sphingobacterium paludis]|uniref:Putative MFS family arabinose efflux permease n=1 Tax=Sphingobacterium paludis TaxID=1476465 RepID=A0A4R7CS53_9SPHI|nr:MFS transporter [Sphingobacterium paludis]TDS10391.1 putative MFS family arabinose efflux permease [Sphingobacterium paludis]